MATTPGLAISLLMMWACWLVTRAPAVGLSGGSGGLTVTLGTFLAGIAVVTCLAPTLAMVEFELWRRLGVVAGIVGGIALIWLVLVDRSVLSWFVWARCCGVLTAYGITLAGLGALLVRMRLSAPLAAGVAVLVGLGWLSWPVWMAPYLAGERGERLVGFLVVGHPLFVINGVLADVFPSPWAQQRIAYVLTNIGDDIPYALPTTVAWCVAGHGLAGAVMLGLSHIGRGGIKAGRQAEQRKKPE
jgi:hypothetical protein